MVSAIVTTAGGIEEDLIKCLAKTYIGEFSLPGADLREKGLNRIGNLLVPNDNYVKFEEWIIPIYDQMLKEQEEAAEKRLAAGADVNDPTSPAWWTLPSSLPAWVRKSTTKTLFSTGLTRMTFLCSVLLSPTVPLVTCFSSTPTSLPRQLRLDIIADIRRINAMAMSAPKAGMVILGGGIIKHHIANACLMRNGADYAVYINTGQEFDGSDAGARPDEAVSWVRSVRTQRRLRSTVMSLLSFLLSLLPLLPVVNRFLDLIVLL